MKKKVLALSLALGCLGGALPASAEIIYESALLGPTGQDATSENSIGIDVRFLGSRFTLTETYDITAIGGHLVTFFGSVWGAIIPMTGSLPEFHYSSIESEALAFGLFNASPSADARAAVNVRLEPGNYGLVFGAQEFFGTDGGGKMIVNNIETPEGISSFFTTSNNIPIIWREAGIANARFVVEGTLVTTQQPPGAVPEPPILALLGLAFAGLAWRRRAR